MTDDSNDNSDLKKISNFNFDENIFNTEPSNSKKKKGKLKKNKGIDFMDYAKDKGIEINLQYEEPKQLEMPKPQSNYKKDFEKQKYENNQKKKPSIDKLKEKKENKIEEKKDNEFKDDYYKERKDNYNQDYDFYDNSYNKSNDYYNNNNRRFFNNFNYKDYDNYDDNYNKNYRRGFNSYYDNYEYDNDYKNSSYRNNYYNNYGYDNRNKNYNYENKRNNNIAIELPDPTEKKNNENTSNSNNNKNKDNSLNYNNQNNINQNIQNKNIQVSNPKIMIPFGNNKFDNSNPKPLYPNPLLGNPMMNNYQMFNINYLNSQLNVNPYIPNYTFLNRDEDILNLIENVFSKKNLNKNLELRLKMLNDEGLVPIDYILNLIKIKGYKKTEEKICEIIEKIGSDIVGKKILENKIFLYPKNYNDIKDSLLSIEEMKKNDEQIKMQQFIAQQQLFMQSQMQMNFMNSMMHPMNMGMYYGPLIWPQQINFNNQINQMRNLEKKNDKE